MLSEFCIDVEGSVMRVSKTNTGYVCGVVFNKLNKSHQIQIDELINHNNNSVLGEMRAVLECEEEYKNGMKSQNQRL
jgi:hypothetical protein